MNKKFPLILLILVFWLAFTTMQPALAQDQEPSFILSMSRDFGYSSGTGRIQGTFSLKIKGPENLVRVIFLIDGTPINEDTEAPFRYQFNTDSYPLGEHTLTATGFTSDGSELTSNEIRVVFAPAEEGGKLVLTILVPLFVIIFGLMALSYVVPAILNRGKNKELPLGQPRNYGMLGGAICPKCKRPFSLTILGIRLGFSRLERCPHCGKWSFVRRQSLDILRAAEAAELPSDAVTEEIKSMTEEERIQKALDDSRFQDL